MNKYIGHYSQLYGVDEMMLLKGKANGMKVLRIYNGKGLDLLVNPDKCCDILKLSIDGMNVSYFSPCGYVSPEFFHPEESEFLKSFTAGFLTTCGLDNAGGFCIDDNEKLSLHGTIGNTPCENYYWDILDDKIIIKAKLRDAKLFGRKLVLERTIECSLLNNSLKITDNVKNIGSEKVPYMLLYHFNIGYPMLSENAKVSIPYYSVEPRDSRAAETMEKCLVMEKPDKTFKEQCYYYDVKDKNGIAEVSVENNDIGKKMLMKYTKENLDCFIEWKMMGEYEYVLGLEPANCLTEGRKIMREKGILKYIEPDETKKHEISISFSNI